VAALAVAVVLARGRRCGHALAEEWAQLSQRLLDCGPG
jgi:hypothetical protein